MKIRRSRMINIPISRASLTRKSRAVRSAPLWLLHLLTSLSVTSVSQQLISKPINIYGEPSWFGCSWTLGHFQALILLAISSLLTGNSNFYKWCRLNRFFFWDHERKRVECLILLRPMPVALEQIASQIRAQGTIVNVCSIRWPYICSRTNVQVYQRSDKAEP
jgi:hypothetical protein